MPTHYFPVADFLAILAAFALFPLVLFLPGYALGWLTNVLRFRSRSWAFRIAASVPLALTILPIAAYTIGRWVSLDAVLGLCGALSACALYLIGAAIKNGSPRLPVRKMAPFIGLIGIWLVIALALLTDIQMGRKLYFSIIAFDYAVRTEFTQSVSTFGIPARNPFFYPGHAVDLRYHYFWMIICALVERLGRGLIDARQAFVAGTMWCGIGMISLVPLYLRVFSPQAAEKIERRSLIGIALLGVTGLDILGALFMLWLQHVGLIQGMSPSVEWWNDQVDGWVYTMLWEPHYVCSLVACLTGFLMLWDVPEDAGWRARVAPGAMSGLAFASSAGAGIYVAMVFAVFLGVWTVVTVVKRWYRETAMLAMAGVTAVVLTVPYLHSLQAANGTGGQLLHLTVREFTLGEMLVKLFGLFQPWQLAIGDLVLLPLNYFLELGFFYLIGSLVWDRFRKRKRPATRQELAALIMAVTSIAICTFVKSSLITNNDLGWRGFLVAQFMLLVWGADLLAMPDGIPQRSKSAAKMLLALGALGVVYDLTLLRFFPLMSDFGMVAKIGWLAGDEQLGLRTYANREAFEWLRARTSSRTTIQQDPNVTFQDTFWGLYGQRQAVSEDQDCGTGFGGNPAICPPIYKRLDRLFTNGNADALEAACQALPVDYFVARDTDPAWKDHTSWEWQRPAAFENDFVHLIPCHKAGAGAATAFVH